MLFEQLRLLLKSFIRRKIPVSPDSHPYRHHFPSRTVFGLTRDELETIKSFCVCNFAIFTLATGLLGFLVVLFVLNKHPFNVPEARAAHFVFASLLIFHVVVSFLGYASTQRENTLAIDIYCVLNGIAIVCDTIMIVYFLYYAEAKIIAYFRSNMLAIFITVFFIISSVLLTVAGTVLEIQVRTHGGTERAAKRTTDSTEDLLTRRLSQQNEASFRYSPDYHSSVLANMNRNRCVIQADVNIPVEDDYDICIRL